MKYIAYLVTVFLALLAAFILLYAFVVYFKVTVLIIGFFVLPFFLLWCVHTTVEALEDWWNGA